MFAEWFFILVVAIWKSTTYVTRARYCQYLCIAYIYLQFSRHSLWLIGPMEQGTQILDEMKEQGVICNI